MLTANIVDAAPVNARGARSQAASSGVRQLPLFRSLSVPNYGLNDT